MRQVIPFLLFLALTLTACGPSRGERMSKAIRRGQDFLAGTQREDGALCDSADALFDIWETVLAADALIDVPADTSVTVVADALEFLQAHEDSAGMVCHNVKCHRSHCLETTAEYFLLMCRIGQKGKVAARMDTVVRLQLPTGEWDIGSPDVRERPTFPSVTAFVLAMLKATGKEPRDAQSAHAWLRDQQTAEGHWGVAWEYYQCPAYALWPVMRALGISVGDEKARKNAVAYIRSSQREDGSWLHESPGRKRLPSAELQTALMLSALAEAGISMEDEACQRGMDYLLEHQRPDGSWDGGQFPAEQRRRPKSEHMIATARAVAVMRHFVQQAPTP